MPAHIGVTGLAVMGANLARNLARNGFTVALHNRSVEKTDALLEKHGLEGDFVRTETLQELVDSLEKPRRVLIMVKAGKPVDSVIEQLEPLLEPGDIIIDAGNPHFEDTRRREAALAAKDLHFVSPDCLTSRRLRAGRTGGVTVLQPKRRAGDRRSTDAHHPLHGRRTVSHPAGCEPVARVESRCCNRSAVRATGDQRMLTIRSMAP
jgi:6-phosphogluconate dehydrogenase (decarboxylating)